MAHLKIITINTWKCDGDYHARMHLLARQLLLLKPDIITCQECFYCRESNADTLGFLAGKLNMNAAFTPGRFKKRYFDGNWIGSQSGLGILSSFPIQILNECRLPSVPDDDDRKVQQAEITLSSELRLLVNNVHLTHLKDPQLKHEQAEALAEAVLNKNYHYNIVCGDFNSTIDAEPINFFKNRTNAIDGYAAGNGPEPRFSLLDPFLLNEKVCVDHIFAVPGKGSSNYPEFINSVVVLDEPDANDLYPSDHFGIATTLITD